MRRGDGCAVLMISQPEEAAMKLTIAQQLSFGTIKIETSGPNGSGSGTGYFLSLDEGLPVIVTNKHVVAGAETGQLTFTRCASDGSPLLGETYCATIIHFEEHFDLHPDPLVDLAVLRIAPLLDRLAKRDTMVFYTQLPWSMVADEEFLSTLHSCEEVIMVGYPRGLRDEKNNMPIVRSGITATAPSIDYEGRSEFVIDCACFPGSSGSPVFLYNSMLHPGEGGLMMGPRVKLIGTLYAGPQFTNEGEIVVRPSPTSDLAVLTRTMMNLGNCVKSTQLGWFREHFLEIYREDLEP
ncbi:serine protease [Sinorhizobium medicae]|nr:serine protease [Sinorhizobium medicae]MDX0592432.1 serine protease [Sinorhizobium medicae]MDX0992074.1 serine protease [Sinorhizobium medicae]MDX1078206.1 serine protease [Sinorhizobium medicae]